MNQLYTPLLPLIVMVLQEVSWNTLYAAQLHKWRFLETCIHLHFTRIGLAHQGIKKASVRYAFCAFLLFQYWQAFADLQAGMGKAVLPRPMATLLSIFTCWTTSMWQCTMFIHRTMHTAVSPAFCMWLPFTLSSIGQDSPSEDLKNDFYISFMPCLFMVPICLL